MKTTKGPLASKKVEACDDPEKSAVPERNIDSSENRSTMRPSSLTAGG